MPEREDDSMEMSPGRRATDGGMLEELFFSKTRGMHLLAFVSAGSAELQAPGFRGSMSGQGGKPRGPVKSLSVHMILYSNSNPNAA
jgi:hypothetical protein